MKVTGYVSCALILTCLLKVAISEKPQNKVDQLLLNALTTDDALKMKRPFCNAFTGCGRKRSFHESSTDLQDSEAESVKLVRLPISSYKILLKAAFQNIRNTVDRDVDDYQLLENPQVSVSRKNPLRKRLDVSQIGLE